MAEGSWGGEWGVFALRVLGELVVEVLVVVVVVRRGLWRLWSFGSVGHWAWIGDAKDGKFPPPSSKTPERILIISHVRYRSDIPPI